MGEWWVMEWVRQYSAPNVVGVRKLKALIFYTINPLSCEKRSLAVFEEVGHLGAKFGVERDFPHQPLVHD